MKQPRSALITGGGTGIGLATAVALRARGYRLTLVGRRPEVLAEAAAELGRGSGPDVAVDVADIGDPASCARVVDSHVNRFAGIDALVAAAGSYEPLQVLDLTAGAWDATLDVHVRGAVLCASAAARHMVDAGGGRIVLVSSVNGFHSERDTVHYSAAKSAIISVARSMAVELSGSGVVTNAVAPGWVSTPMTLEYLQQSTPERMRTVNPVGRAGRPEEIARVITFLIDDAPEFLTGATLVVDGGQTAMAPLP